MLLPAEADIVRRDPALPGLATLLDPGAFAAALRRALPTAPLEAARISYVKYKPGKNCLVSYRLQVGDETVLAHAKTYRPPDRNKLRWAREQSAVPGALGPGRLVLEDCTSVVSVFPNDSEVTSLPCWTDPEQRRGLLGELLPDQPDLRECGLQVLVYKPERRCVARLDAGGEARLALKVYTELGYQAARGKAAAFASRGPLRLAPWLGSSDRHATLAFEWRPGRLLSESLEDSHTAPGTLAAVGAAVAQLHAQRPQGLPYLTREAEAASLLSEANTLGLLWPPLARRAEDLARRLAARLVQEPPVRRPVHGDFHARQVLFDDGAVTLLDLDRAVCGDPLLDLGTFIAHLEREVVRGNLSPGRTGPLREALLDGYGAATRQALPERVALYTAAELLRLAPRFFRYAEPGWPDRAEAALDRAEAALTAGTPPPAPPPALPEGRRGP